MNYDMIYLEWFDACSFDEWENIESAKDLHPHLIRSVGWLISEDADKIVIAMNIDEEREDVSMTMAIPVPWILVRERIPLS